MKRNFGLCVFGMVVLLAGGAAEAVKTVYIEQSTEIEFQKGKTDKVIVSSEGELSLAYETDTLLEADGGTWLINAITGDEAGRIYAATSGEGLIWRIDGEQHEVIYGQGEGDAKHVFSLAVDQQGRLLAGTGGDKGLVLRFDSAGAVTTLFEADRIAYIWQIVVGPGGRIYLGTGPTGEVITLDPDGMNPQVLFKAKDKNILALALDVDGVLYAGGDQHGLVYRIDPATGEATIAYDTGHQEISGLVFDKKHRLYIATGDSRVRKLRGKLILSDGEPGRVEDGSDDQEPAEQMLDNEKAEQGDGNRVIMPDESPGKDGGPVEVADEEPSPEPTPPPADQQQPGGEPEPGEMPLMQASRANEVFQRTPQGYVKTVFSKSVVILSMVYDASRDSLVLGTGTDGQLLRVHVETGEAAIVHTAKPSMQVSVVYVDAGGTIYAGLANPAGLAAIRPVYSKQGEYESEVIDAKQVSRWGRIQIESAVPEATRLMISTRTGNTKKPDDGPWQGWSEAVDVADSVEVTSAVGRFLQYRLTFTSDGVKTPEVYRVLSANSIPNLPPTMTSVTVDRDPKKNAKAKKQSFYVNGDVDIRWKGEDPNQDRLQYQIYVRPAGLVGWVRIEKDFDKTNLKWDTRTAADGRYEVKVEASDVLDNSPDQAMSDSRISRPFVVDNTPPEISELSYSVEGNRVIVRAKAVDAQSCVNGVAFCLDSDADWQVVLPEDGVFDSRDESVMYSLDIPEAGSHLLAVRFSDVLENTTYRNLIISIPK